MAKHVTVELTPLEAEQVHALLVAVTMNGDLWTGYDTRALARADSKLVRAIRTTFTIHPPAEES